MRTIISTCIQVPIIATTKNNSILNKDINRSINNIRFSSPSTNLKQPQLRYHQKRRNNSNLIIDSTRLQLHTSLPLSSLVISLVLVLFVYLILFVDGVVVVNCLIPQQTVSLPSKVPTATSMLSRRVNLLLSYSSSSSSSSSSKDLSLSLSSISKNVINNQSHRYKVSSEATTINLFQKFHQRTLSLQSQQQQNQNQVTDKVRKQTTFLSSVSRTMASSSSPDKKGYNKRANLPFSIMDKEIEEYAATSTSNNNSNTTETLENSTTALPQRQISEYEKWVRRLYATNLFLPVKLGLENMEAIHTALGNPVDDIVVVHIAGTNGKGSVTYKIAKTLQAANPTLKVGLFSSPHISSFRERMQVNDVCITEEQVVELLPPIYKICQEQNIPATFFEITTALAFSYYKAMGCDVISLETGLGGRLDATNIVKEPALSIITSIGLEHTRILGDTVELIAVEKGGIIKANCPVLVGPNCPQPTLRDCATTRNASAYYTIPDVLGSIPTSSTSTSLGDNDIVEEEEDYDVENSRIATAAIKLLQQSKYSQRLGITSLTDSVIEYGTSHRPPCRFEIMSIPLFNYGDDVPDQLDQGTNITVVLDVAHNPPAMEYMVRKLNKTFGNTAIQSLRIVVGMSADKDMKHCGSTLVKAVRGDTSKIHLVQAAHPRAATIEAILQSTGFDTTGVHYDLVDRSITKQITVAKQSIVNDLLQLVQEQEATKDRNITSTSSTVQPVLVICGSVFLMAEAREALGIVEPRDSDVISELAGAGSRHSQENFGNTPNNDLSK